MTVYLDNKLRFESKHKRLLPQVKKVRSPRPVFIFVRTSFPDIFRAFLITSLVLFNIGLITIAGLWFLLVFSVVTPVELIEMYNFNPPQTLVVKGDEYTLASIKVPPPPALTASPDGGLNSTP